MKLFLHFYKRNLYTRARARCTIRNFCRWILRVIRVSCYTWFDGNKKKRKKCGVIRLRRKTRNSFNCIPSINRDGIMRKFDRADWYEEVSRINKTALPPLPATAVTVDLILPAEPYRILPILLGTAGAFFRRAAIRGEKSRNTWPRCHGKLKHAD